MKDPVITPTPTFDDISQWYEQATKHERAGEERDAEPCYRMVHALGWHTLPEHEQVGFFVGFGSTLRINQKLDESIETLEEGLYYFPAHPEIKAFLALAYYMNRQDRQAVQVLFPALLESSIMGLAGFEKALSPYLEKLGLATARTERPEEVRLYPPNPEWPKLFKQIARELEIALFGLSLEVEHIGSTSIAGLAAKNKIDIQIGVARLDDDFKGRVDKALTGMGLNATTWRDDHVPPGDDPSASHWRKLYVSGNLPEMQIRTNIHIRVRGAANYEYALLFRDYLRQHKDAAAVYARAKQELARYHPRDAEAYSTLKDPICDLIMVDARRWRKTK